MNDILSLRTLQRHSAFKQDVEVQIGEKLTGGFGKTIYSAKWLNGNDSPIVVLQMKGDTASGEVMLYLTLDHPHIIQTYGLIRTNIQTDNKQSIFLVQERAESGDLGRFLSDRFFIPLNSVLLEIFIQISDAMIFLSNNNIIHGDLACRNVLVIKSHPTDPKRNLVKLIDFGLTRDQLISSDVKVDYPVRYAASEIIRSHGRSGYSEKSDVYSFAVLMWEAYCCHIKMPYESISDDGEVCRRKLNGEKLPRPDKCDSKIWTLMLDCWNDRPEDRPTFQMIHTRLINIQNQEMPSDTSGSIISSSSSVEHVPSLLQSECNICADCGSQYTDYRTHLNICPAQDSVSEIPDERNQQISRGQPSPISNHSSSSLSSSEMNDQELVPCEFCTDQYSIHELSIHQSNCMHNPVNRKSKIFPPRPPTKSDRTHRRQERYRSGLSYQSTPRSISNSDRNINNPSRLPSVDIISPFRSSSYKADNNSRVSQQKRTRPTQQYSSQSQISIPKISPPLNTIQVPCEICTELIDESHYRIHLQQCDEKNQRRIEEQRMRIEKQETIKELPCQFCGKKYPIANFHDHEDNCEFNPTIVPDRSMLSHKRSISSPNLRDPWSTDELSKSLERSSKAADTNKQTQQIDDKKKKKSKTGKLTKNKEESSRLRSFFSRIFSSKKKS